MVLVMMALVTMVLVMILEIVSSQGKHTQHQTVLSLQIITAYNSYIQKTKDEEKRRAGQSAYDILFNEFDRVWSR
jgi:hypothetical protein